MIDLGKLFILGDSYSTFAGWIPQGYDTWYTENTSPSTDVTQVSQTWWHQLLTATQSELLLNCSYSGTTIGNTGYDGADCSEISFIARLDKLLEAGFFKENPADTLIVFGGTNDSWSGAPVGQLQYDSWTREDVFRVLPAVGYLLHRLKTRLPQTRVIVLINGDELKPEITQGLQEACRHYGMEQITLGGISMCEGHPNIAGMAQIAKQLLQYLENP